MEQGLQIRYVARSKIDTNPPKELEREVEEFLAERKPKRHDYIIERFHGKGGKGYFIKDWHIHRGRGAPRVNRNFRQAVMYYESKNRNVLTNRVAFRMKIGGPRYAGQGRGKKANVRS